MALREKIAQAKAEIRSCYKSEDTEEWWDKVFTKPLGYLWTKFFLALHWTPNMVTILSMFIGVAGGIMLYPKSFVWNLVGILLIIWANILDSTDGQMARLTGIKSTLGRCLDAMSTTVWYVAIYGALGLRLMSEPIPFTGGRLWGWWIWLVIVASSIGGHGLQCMMADYYRNLHLFFLRNRHGSELTRAADVERQRAETPRSQWFKRFYLYLYAAYTRVQENNTPSVQRLLDGISAEEAEGRDLNPEIRENFLKHSRKICQLPNILTFNTRAYTSFVCILLGVPVLYFAIELILGTALLVFTILKYESISEHVLKKFKLTGWDGPKPSRIPWRLIFFLIGVVGAIIMFVRSDLELVDWSGTVLAKMPFWLPSLLALWLVIYLLHTLVYKIIIGRTSTPVPFFHMLKVVISGFALNHVTPVGLAGGEPYRIMELKPHIGGSKATATTLTFSGLYIFSHLLFWLSAGIMFLIMGCPGGLASAPIVVIICLVCLLACWPLFTGGKKGFVMPTLQLLTHIPWAGKLIARKLEKDKEGFLATDREISAFYANRPRFWISLALEYLGRILEVVEYFLIFLFLEHEVSFPQCMVALATASLIGNLIFIVPMQIGARESGLTLGLRWFGVPSSFSMTAGLMARVRELIWLAVGVIAMLIRGKQPSSVNENADESEGARE